MPVDNIKYEYSPKWAKPYRYDGYFKFNNNNYVIEMDGAQHYLEQNGFGIPLEKQQETDYEKDRLAKENNHILIRIDCRKSDAVFIKSQLENSMFNAIFDLSYINWTECEEKACKNIIKDICEYYNDNPIRIFDIAKIFHTSDSTIRRSLKKGTQFGWCNYDKSLNIKMGAVEGEKKKMKPTIIFDRDKNLIKCCESIKECEEYLRTLGNDKVSGSQISKARKKGTLYKGYYFMKGENDYDICVPQ